MDTTSIWDLVVQIHANTDWGALTLFYGGILLVGYLAVAEILRIRTSSTTHTVERRAEDLEEEIKNLRARQKRMVNYMKEQMDDQAREHQWKMEELRRRMGKVEDRIPSLYEHLDEFRATLSTVLEKELGEVMHSFDSSVDSVLDQMQEQLETGIQNIEGIKSMVRGRKAAEHNLLESADLSTLQEAADTEENTIPEVDRDEQIQEAEAESPEIPELDEQWDEETLLEDTSEDKAEEPPVELDEDEEEPVEPELVEADTEVQAELDEPGESPESAEKLSEEERDAPGFVDDYESWLAAQQAMETQEADGSGSEEVAAEEDVDDENRDEAA